MLPSKPHRNGTDGHWEAILDEVEVPSKTDIPKALNDRMKDNQRIIGERVD